MTAAFPNSIKNFYADVVDNVDDVLATHVNELRAEVVAIETYLFDPPWIASVGNWTRVSASSFTVPGNWTAYYKFGLKIRWMDSSVTKYGIVRSSTYSAPDTTVNIIVNTSYTIAASITAGSGYYSFGNPGDFPYLFSYTPTGVSATNVTLTGQFQLVGRQCFVNLRCAFAGGITFTTMPSLPIAASASLIGAATVTPFGSGSYFDSGTAQYPNGLMPSLEASATVVTIGAFSTGVSISATSPITWAVSDYFEVHFSYMV